MLRADVLKLYREILRTVRLIPDEHYRKEMAKWARDDFKKNKDLTDEVRCNVIWCKTLHKYSPTQHQVLTYTTPSTHHHDCILYGLTCLQSM